jgi:hypothetical protein
LMRNIPSSITASQSGSDARIIRQGDLILG